VITVYPASKGQSGIEMIVLLSFIILFSIPLILLLGSINDRDLAVRQARSDVQLLTDTANSVFIMGCDSKRVLLLSYPSGLRNITIRDREVIFTLDGPDGPIDVIGISIAPLDESSDLVGTRTLTGYVGAGTQKVLVTCDPSSGKVRFDLLER